MKLTASGLSVFAGILTIPPTVAWYLDHIGVIHLPVNLNDWLLGSAVSCFVVAMIANAFVHRGMGKLIGQQDRSGPQTSGTNPTTFLNVDDFYRTYDNVFLREVETLVQQQSNQYREGPDRERYLARYAATILGTALFEYLWFQIGGSQWRALNALNVKPHTLDEIHVYYDEGKKSRPDFYQAYSFEQWLAFLRSAGFILETNNNVQVTVRAKEFLKYLTHQGYDIAAKIG